MTDRSLSAQNLWKYYDGRPVVKGVSFTIHSGEILGLLGANGAGKSTTVGMLYGSVIPSQGLVTIGQYDVRRQGRAARQMMGIVTQDDNLDPDFNVIDNLIYFAHHYRIVGKKARRYAENLLERVGLSDYIHRKVDELSGGLKRRLVLARALLARPAIVFLDEPTTGLDPHARQDFWRLVLELKNNGCGILLTTHYMDEAQRLSDRLLLLRDGEVIEEGSPASIITRVVGAEVAEISGGDRHVLEQIALEFNTWSIPFGNSFLIPLPAESAAIICQRLSDLRFTLKRREGNLEDVFLRLTGQLLDD